MEFLTVQFFSALLAIVLIDLVLAGDNAIVIALAARNLPKHLRKSAIIWGTVGAIVVRAAMTLAVVWLLKIPGLMAIGGIALVWIAYKLLLPNAKDGEDHSSASNFWEAMRTIIIADAIMGLDNVLAIGGVAAGSEHGGFMLVVLGLLISIPIVVWGSTLILKWVERFPIIVYLGAGVLAYTAAKMFTHEPLLEAHFIDNPLQMIAIQVVTIALVLFAGFVANRNHAARKARPALQDIVSNGERQKEEVMKTILIPVGDSSNADYAVLDVIREAQSGAIAAVHLVHVHPRFNRHIGPFVAWKNVASMRDEQANKVFARIATALEAAGIEYHKHSVVGERAKEIVKLAKQCACDEIVMGTMRKASLLRWLEGSLSNDVIRWAAQPVRLIQGEDIPTWRRLGVPAGVGIGLVLILLAAD